jgi:hypothetical protein
MLTRSKDRVMVVASLDFISGNEIIISFWENEILKRCQKHKFFNNNVKAALNK